MSTNPTNIRIDCRGRHQVYTSFKLTWPGVSGDHEGRSSVATSNEVSPRLNFCVWEGCVRALSRNPLEAPAF
uniref:Uncharacterized protein n=1 Tax=Strongyloides venezuelensis TaxID=75913 RepID=A0A0K0EYK1_STRVS